MTEQQALQIIGAQIVQTFANGWKKSWDAIRGPYHHPDHPARIRSDLLREHAVIHSKHELQELGLKHVWEQGQHMFVLPGKVLFILKKLDEGQRPHKGETDRSKLLFQSTLFDDLPTLIVGMQPNLNWTDYVGIFICRPNTNGIGNAWTLNITDGVADAESSQTSFIGNIDESDTKQQKPKPKWKPKHDPNIGESSEEAGSGGGPGN